MPPTQDQESSVERRLGRIEQQLSEIGSALRGAMGGPGLMQHVIDLQGRVAKMEAERNIQRGMTILAAGICAGLVTLGLNALIG
jgi:hypothetical protein